MSQSSYESRRDEARRSFEEREVQEALLTHQGLLDPLDDDGGLAAPKP